MRVAIDLTALMPRATGVDEFLLRLVEHLSGVDQTAEYTIFVNAGDRARLPALGANFGVTAASLRNRAARLVFQQCALPVAAYLRSFDVVHSPSFLMPMWRGPARHVLSVHDLTMFSSPDLHTRLRRNPLFLRAVAAGIRRADRICVPSECTRRDLLARFPEVAAAAVRVIPYGVGARFSPAPREVVAEHLDRLGVRRPYLLHVGTIEPRKNLAVLLAAFGLLLRDGANNLHLVLAGAPGWGTAPGLSTSLAVRVHMPGYVAEEDLVWLYRGAAAFVYPSLYEGFGFPPLEAMACGVPVIASRGSAVEENLEGAADLVAPDDVDGLAAAIRRVVGEPGRRAAMIERGRERAACFTWERTARAFAACYGELASNCAETPAGAS